MVNNAREESAIEANADSMKSFTPRFVARCLGVHVSVILNMCDRKEALGELERFYDDIGEVRYKRKKRA